MRLHSFLVNRRSAIGMTAVAMLIVVGGSCSDNQGRLSPPATSTGGAAMTGGQGGSAGAQSTGGSAGVGGAAPTGGSAGEGGDGASAGMGTGGSSGAGGTAGAGGEAGDGPTDSCIFGGDDGGAGGEGGMPSLPPGITVRTSPYVGKYLADATGRALYTWGGDLPGDCRTDPVSRCAGTCSTAWPAFNNTGGLPPEVSSDFVGSIPGPASSPMTTYYGWPLYYYGQDMLDSMTMVWSVKGQAVGRVWHLAKLSPSNVVIMKEGTVLYLGDQLGMTLYTYIEDMVGTDPVSDCTGTCLDDYRPFTAGTLSPVSALEPSDFRLFVRPDTGQQQVAYKGAPLYRAAVDQKSGDTLGTAVPGFAIAAP